MNLINQCGNNFKANKKPVPSAFSTFSAGRFVLFTVSAYSALTSERFTESLPYILHKSVTYGFASINN